MLELRSLSVSVGDTPILSDISCVFESGKTYFLAGKNGSGKSSLALTLMGHPRYGITDGDILLDGRSIKALSPMERSHAGVFLSLQNVPEIPGVKLGEYLRTIYNEHLKRTSPETKALTPFVFRRFVKPLLEKFSIPEAFLDRELNVGFSGGEKRRIEMVQIELLQPKIVIVDEIDSGLDIEAFVGVAKALATISTPDRTLIIITHNYRLKEFVPPLEVVLLEGGKLKERGNETILERLEKTGF